MTKNEQRKKSRPVSKTVSVFDNYIHFFLFSGPNTVIVICV